MRSKFRTTEISDGRYNVNGLRFITVKSKNLRGRGDICVYVPEGAKDGNTPLIILLHGVYGSNWMWALKGGAHHTMQELINNNEIRNMVLAMPSDGLWGDGSGYFKHNDIDFERWIADDVPAALIENTDCISVESKLFISGLSMGGYGAMRIGAKYPNKFAAISAHSSLTDFKHLAMFVEEELSCYRMKEPDLTVLSSIVSAGDSFPPLRFDCGMDDDLLSANRELSVALNERKIKHIYEEFPGGHEWPYWQENIKETFRFFNQF